MSYYYYTILSTDIRFPNYCEDYIHLYYLEMIMQSITFKIYSKILVSKYSTINVD